MSFSWVVRVSLAVREVCTHPRVWASLLWRFATSRRDRHIILGMFRAIRDHASATPIEQLEAELALARTGEVNILDQVVVWHRERLARMN